MTKTDEKDEKKIIVNFGANILMIDKIKNVSIKIEHFFYQVLFKLDQMDYLWLISNKLKIMLSCDVLYYNIGFFEKVLINVAVIKKASNRLFSPFKITLKTYKKEFFTTSQHTPSSIWIMRAQHEQHLFFFFKSQYYPHLIDY